MFRPLFGANMKQLADKNGRLRVCTRCNNHIPEPVVPKFEVCGEVRMRNGYFEIKLLSGLPVELIGKAVHVVLTEREAV